MLQAMLHGRLTRKEEDLEDLLTSNTFGLMKYLPFDEVLIPFLSLGQNPFSQHSLGDWLKDVKLVEHLDFWTTLAGPGCKPCEPDVEILFRHKDGNKTWLLVEAKYLSGKSSQATSFEKAPNDQLAREFDNLRAIAEEEGIARYAVVYLTADYVCPKREIQESAKEYKAIRGTSPRIYWLSWRALFDVLESRDSRDFPISQDLRELLVHLNLRRFRQLRSEELRLCEWDFTKGQISSKWFVSFPHWRFERKLSSWNWGLAPISGRWGFPS